VEDHNEKTTRFVGLMGAHDRRLFSYILSLVPNYADAEELAQQVRIRLWQQFDEYDAGKDFGRWARSIAHYLILAYYKKLSADRVRFSPQTVENIADKAGTFAEKDNERNRALHECLGRMNEAKRQLLVRYYSTGETLREIANQIGRTFDAVRHSVLRTRLALADCIERVLRREGA